MAFCKHCQRRPIPPHNRVYCAVCSAQSVRLWKARERKRWASEWRAGGRVGSPPYLDGWPSREAYRAYYREYMRAWRKRHKDAASRPSASVERSTHDV